MFIEPRISGERRGWIEVICGSMFSGKTEELIRRLKRVKIANLKAEIFKPAIDMRYDEIKIVSHDTNFIQSTPTGVLVSSKLSSSILLIDFNKELIYGLKDSKFTEYVQKKSKIKNGLIYSTDSSLILYDNLNDSLESLSFSKNDLKLININLFDKNTLQDINWMEFAIPTLILIIIVLIILFITINQKYNKTKILIRTDQVYTLDEKKKTINDFIKNLSEIEIQILEVLVRNNWNFMNTSAAEINKKLGTGKKDTKIQNNIRGEILSSINNKFSVYSSIKEDLINRKKMDFDKRHVEYYVNENLIKKFPKKIFD